MFSVIELAAWSCVCVCVCVCVCGWLTVLLHSKLVIEYDAVSEFIQQADICPLQAGEKSSSSTVASSVSQTSKVPTTSTGKPATAAKTSPSSSQKENEEVVRSRLMKLEPKELMKEIVSGHVPLSLLNQVASRLPAEMLQEAVDFLSKSDSDGGSDAKSESCESSFILFCLLTVTMLSFVSHRSSCSVY